MHTIKSGNLAVRCSFDHVISQVIKRSQNKFKLKRDILNGHFFVFFGTAASFMDNICSLVIEAKREAILFFSVCSEVNSTCCLITSELANQNAQKALYRKEYNLIDNL